MKTGEPSRTAYGAARHRAVHQLLEGGRLFADPLAVRMLGAGPAELAEEAAQAPEQRPLRLFIAARSRFSEDAVAAAHADGLRQLVVLGAGFDTFGYRQEHPGLRVFEVDHPATQEWKRRRVAEAGIAVPASLTYVGVDFERESFVARLAEAGFDSGRPAFFSWLGVVPYLTREAVLGTLRLIAALPGGAQVVFDYAEPVEALSPEYRARREAAAARVAAIGEPWLTHFGVAELAGELAALGFAETEDLGPGELAVRYFGLPPGTASGAGGHVIRAVSGPAKAG
ncbi:class I SAM-dependent methyltransferase [Kitasatospora sp. NPDC002227]|uniref:class I SAM-dependent methyltransferase n=1 Tax=Kitasatospora sp. NPDC002227 TaxID=3154773 RepID=UPI003319AAEB